MMSTMILALKEIAFVCICKAGGKCLGFYVWKYFDPNQERQIAYGFFYNARLDIR
jgi:hypothetical protein